MNALQSRAEIRPSFVTVLGIDSEENEPNGEIEKTVSPISLIPPLTHISLPQAMNQASVFAGISARCVCV
jgi:hypothetical protein